MTIILISILWPLTCALFYLIGHSHKDTIMYHQGYLDGHTGKKQVKSAEERWLEQEEA